MDEEEGATWKTVQCQLAAVRQAQEHHRQMLQMMAEHLDAVKQVPALVDKLEKVIHLTGHNVEHVAFEKMLHEKRSQPPPPLPPSSTSIPHTVRGEGMSRTSSMDSTTPRATPFTTGRHSRSPTKLSEADLLLLEEEAEACNALRHRAVSPSSGAFKRLESRNSNLHIHGKRRNSVSTQPIDEVLADVSPSFHSRVSHDSTHSPKQLVTLTELFGVGHWRGMTRSLGTSMNETSHKWYPKLWSVIQSTHVRFFWDVLLIVVVVVTSALVPLVLVYSKKSALWVGASGATMVMVDLLWGLAVVINCITGYMDATQDNPEVVTAKHHFYYYYSRGWLAVDFLSLWPVMWTPDWDPAIWTVSVLKLTRMLRLAPLCNRLQKELHCPVSTVLLMKVAITVLLWSHILACAWRLSLRFDRDPQGEEENWGNVYVKDVYWLLMTTTTVGYGDIVPTGIWSRVFSIVVMLMAPFFFGTIVSALTHVTKDLFDNPGESQLAQVRRFMVRRRVPADLQSRVEHNLRKNLQQEHSQSMDPVLFASLSPAVQRELSLALLSNTVLQFPLFVGAPYSFVAELAQAHTWVHCIRGDLVVEEGMLVQDIHFVIHGRIIMTSTDTKAGLWWPTVTDVNVNKRKLGLKFVLEHHTGAWFGEACLFDPDAVHNASAIAMEETELAVLGSIDYIRISKKYVRVQERHRQLEHALKTKKISPKALEHHPRKPQDFIGTAQQSWSAVLPLPLLRRPKVSVATDLEYTFSEDAETPELH